jgi:cytochrome P450
MGPQGWELLDPHVLDDPYPFYSKLHGEPVWRIPGTEIFLVSSYDLLCEATARTEDFSSVMTHILYRDDSGMPARQPFRVDGGEVLATVDPPIHTVHKQAIFPEFVSKRMLLLEPKVLEWSESAVRNAVAKGRVEFMDTVANFVPISVIAYLIGFKDPDLYALLRAAFESTSLLSGAMSKDEFLQFQSFSQEVNVYLGRQLAAASPQGETLLNATARAIHDKIISFPEGIILLNTFLSAGGESTTSLIGCATRMLADNPALQERLRANPDLIPKFVEEALRFESPFRNHMRSVPKDTELGGIEVPAGSTVLLMWGAANRDPKVFSHPETVDITRRNRQVAFGRGIHTCIGAPLARLESRVVLGVLLKRTQKISVDLENPARWERSLLVRRYKSLPLILEAAR